MKIQKKDLMRLHYWMKCPNCGVNWFYSFGDPTQPKEYYHQCEGCGFIHYPPTTKQGVRKNGYNQDRIRSKARL